MDEHRHTSAASRRGVLTGLTALAAATMLPHEAAAQGAARAAKPVAKPFRIDVHHHLAAPAWVAHFASSGQLAPVISKEWSPARSIEDMDRGGTATSILSVTIPGVWVGDVETSRKLARDCNEYAMRLVTDHPGRFGMFPALPLPDVDGSLREIEYVLDVLKADGIGLLTSYGDKWLGDPAFDPVMAELNRRKAVVYTHPTVANCCRNLVADVPPAIVEYGTDTSRAIAKILFGGVAARYPDIRWIFSHAGGAVPFLLERFVFQAKNPKSAAQLPHGVMHELRKFHYDIAQAFQAPPLLALKKMVPISQIVFGTDFPFRSTEEHVKGLRDAGVFSAQELHAIERDNALRLLPPRYRV
jgi:predicted TIM-barrel fold metal-dependent hydrolase